MTKKYLIEDFEEFKGSYIFDKQDAKEVEVLDEIEMSNIMWHQSKFQMEFITDFLLFAKENNLLIVKIIE